MSAYKAVRCASGPWKRHPQFGGLPHQQENFSVQNFQLLLLLLFNVLLTIHRDISLQ